MTSEWHGLIERARETPCLHTIRGTVASPWLKHCYNPIILFTSHISTQAMQVVPDFVVRTFFGHPATATATAATTTRLPLWTLSEISCALTPALLSRSVSLTAPHFHTFVAKA